MHVKKKSVLSVIGDDEKKLNTNTFLVKVYLFLRYKALKIWSKFIVRY
jgi:hypothetical protein